MAKREQNGSMGMGTVGSSGEGFATYVAGLPTYRTVEKKPETPTVDPDRLNAEIEKLKQALPKYSFDKENIKIRQAARTTIDSRIKSFKARYLIEERKLEREKASLVETEVTDGNILVLQGEAVATAKILNPAAVREANRAKRAKDREDQEQQMAEQEREQEEKEMAEEDMQRLAKKQRRLERRNAEIPMLPAQTPAADEEGREPAIPILEASPPYTERGEQAPVLSFEEMVSRRMAEL